jgi:hypothetical protein
MANFLMNTVYQKRGMEDIPQRLPPDVVPVTQMAIEQLPKPADWLPAQKLAQAAMIKPGPAMNRNVQGALRGAELAGRGAEAIANSARAVGGRMHQSRMENQRLAAAEKKEAADLARAEEIRQRKITAYGNALKANPGAVWAQKGLVEAGGDISQYDIGNTTGGYKYKETIIVDEAIAARTGLPPETIGKPYEFAFDENNNPTPLGPAVEDKSGTTVNILPGEKKFAEGLGAGASKQVAEIYEGGRKSYSTLAKLDALGQMFKSFDSQGRLDPTLATVGSWAESLGIDPALLGIDPNLPASADALNAAITSLTTGMIGPGGFPANQFTEADREFILSTFPQLGDLPGAVDLKLEVLRRDHQYKVDFAHAVSNFLTKNPDATHSEYTAFAQAYMYSKKDTFKDLVAKARSLSTQNKGVDLPSDRYERLR